MIVLKDIVKKYGQREVLKNISLTIEQGEFVVLEGVSGSGKTTLLSLIAALHKPTSGEVKVDTLLLSKLPDHFASDFRRENIGIIFQRYNLIHAMSVEENVSVVLLPSTIKAQELQKKVYAQLERYSMREFAKEEVQNLSGGQQQRVAIARATLNNPKIILADEPTSNLDEKLSQEFIKHMRELKAEGKTIVIATHDSRFFGLDCVDRIIRIENGEIKG